MSLGTGDIVFFSRVQAAELVAAAEQCSTRRKHLVRRSPTAAAVALVALLSVPSVQAFVECAVLTDSACSDFAA